MSLHARSNRRAPGVPPKLPRQGGFSLIELSVAILIALFLIGGVLTVEQGIHSSFQANSQLSQLEDNERFAMSLITEIVQRAGYYPSPATNTLVSALPAETTTTPQGGSVPLAGGQYLFGIDNAGSGNITRQDSFFVRYMTAAGQGINVCDGTAGGTATYTNYFYIAADATNTSTYDLYCELQPATGAAWNAAVPLVNGLAGITVTYGVHTKTYNGQVDNNVDYYMSAATVTANSDWPNVTSIKVKLKFLNPLYQQPGQPNYVYFTRLIAVMSRTGQEVGP
jgi:type IV pilus assembly protein PilW